MKGQTRPQAPSDLRLVESSEVWRSRRTGWGVRVQRALQSQRVFQTLLVVDLEQSTTLEGACWVYWQPWMDADVCVLPSQAVMSSDFAISRFRHLKKLLLVHGHWCYSRLARMVVYYFYKNVVSRPRGPPCWAVGVCRGPALPSRRQHLGLRE